MIEIIAPGPFTTVQDLGRPGRQALGVPLSGAFDRSALRLANRLVGNPDDAAGFELTLGGLQALVVDAATIAFTGALCPGAPDWGTAVTVPAGTRLRLGTPRAGLRSYLAVRGGLAVAPTLGSGSTDTLSGLGPAPLTAGDQLLIGPPAAGSVTAAVASTSVQQRFLRIRFGPRDDWFAAGALHTLLAAEWTVRAESDRVGLRLAGPALARQREGELASEPMLPGAVQVPPTGQPIVFGPDAPTTGGYPVIAVVVGNDLDRAAQLRPGDTVRFSRAGER